MTWLSLSNHILKFIFQDVFVPFFLLSELNLSKTLYTDAVILWKSIVDNLVKTKDIIFERLYSLMITVNSCLYELKASISSDWTT